MIPIDSFSPNPLRQGRTPLCMLFSYAIALYPFTRIHESQTIQEIAVFAGVNLDDPGAVTAIGDRLHVPRHGTTGYDWLEIIHRECPTDVLNKARQKVLIQRVSRIAELETMLKNQRSTSVVAMTFTNGRAPHSMAVAFDSQHGFFVRDSATARGLSNLPCVDAIGTDIKSAILQLDSCALLGESICIAENL